MTRFSSGLCLVPRWYTLRFFCSWAIFVLALGWCAGVWSTLNFRWLSGALPPVVRSYQANPFGAHVAPPKKGTRKP